MSDDQKELMKVLPGLREDMPEPFLETGGDFCRSGI